MVEVGTSKLPSILVVEKANVSELRHILNLYVVVFGARDILFQ